MFRDADNYRSLDYPLQLLLFPEGGDLTAMRKLRSDAYADENKLPHYTYCLHPHTAGFVYVVNTLRSGLSGGLDAVYDITIAYPLASTEIEFGWGVIPREVHFHIKNYAAKDLPTSDEGLAEWCKDRWREKEERLKDFYTHREFLERKTGDEVEGDGVNGDVCYWKPQEVIAEKNYLSLYISIAYFALTQPFFLYLLLGNWYSMLLGVAGGLFLFYVSYCGGGLDYLVLRISRVSMRDWAHSE